MQQGVRPGDVLADRYLLVDLLTESDGGRFWRAHDRVLARHVALHVVSADDRRAERLLVAARRSATITDRRLLRVLDAEERAGLCFVVNEWGQGRSLDLILATEGALSPRRAAWVVREAAAGLATAHEAGCSHGHLVPENVLIDRSGAVRLIGFSVDAALRGLEPSPTGDVRGLAGVLYAALTGKWPGPHPSQVPAAPREGDLVLRPRQVRAGVPRTLDTVCDHVLNPAGTHLDGSYDAARLAAELSDVVGDDTGMAAAEAARHRAALDSQPPVPVLPPTVASPPPTASPTTAPTTPTTPTPAAPAAGLALEDDPSRPAEPAQQPHPEPAEPATQVLGPTVTAAPATPATDATDATDATEDASADQGVPGAPTEAGMPIFDEEADEVDWLRHHTEPPTPPPPFEDPPERPLFAPGPPDDARTHRGRQEESSRVSTSDSFWPWETGVGAPPPSFDDEPETDGSVPGRRWLVLGVVLIVATLVAIGGVVAFNNGRGGGLLGSEDQPARSAQPTRDAATAEPFAIAGVTDLDPQGDPPEENPELTSLTVDGDPETAWRTNTYTQQLGPGGLKTGLGLVVDLGEFRDVASVRVAVSGETRLAAYVADTEPSDVADLPRQAETSGSGTVSLDLAEPDTGRFVVVWFEALPQVSDGFRVEVSEIAVLG